MTKYNNSGRRDELFSSSRKIFSLIFDKRYEDARSLIDTEQEKFPESEAHRFMAFSAVLHARLGEVEKGIALMRQAVREAPTWLPHLSRLSDMLIDTERWEEADAVLKEVISLSLANDDVYFLDDSRFKRAVCLSMLGRTDELKRVKAELPKGVSFFIGGELLLIDDIV